MRSRARRPGLAPVVCLLPALLVFGLALSACAPALPTPSPYSIPLRATPTPLVVVAVVGPAASLPPPAGTEPGRAAAPDSMAGIVRTLETYIPTEDPEGSKAKAFATLREFVNPQGVYAGAWWLANDGRADIYELLTVVLFTEGSLNVRVQQAIAARYLWYCGGTGAECSGAALINFLSYFQPWREPFAAGARFTTDKAQEYLPFASDLVWQRPGVLTALIPGADSYVRNPDGLNARAPVDWPNTPFHFANVHPTWDAYLRERLGRGPNGENRLWVLTFSEAGRVCPSVFVCDNMTQEKQ